jgi:hypothetical protein
MIIRKDDQLLAEAYNRMYLKENENFPSKEAAMDNLEAASEHRDLKAAQADVNHEKGLKKYTYEILYKTDYKYDPKTKKAISYSYKTHSSGKKDERHKFAYSDDDFWAQIKRSGFGIPDDELKKTIVITRIEPANTEEAEAVKKQQDAMHAQYHGPNALKNSGD